MSKELLLKHLAITKKLLKNARLVFDLDQEFYLLTYDRNRIAEEYHSWKLESYEATASVIEDLIKGEITEETKEKDRLLGDKIRRQDRIREEFITIDDKIDTLRMKQQKIVDESEKLSKEYRENTREMDLSIDLQENLDAIVESVSTGKGQFIVVDDNGTPIEVSNLSSAEIVDILNNNSLEVKDVLGKG